MKRTMLVTGANRGIGLAIARQLAELGHSVLLGSRDPSAGDAAAAPLRRRGLDVAPVHLDLTAPATIDAAINHIPTSGRAVDTLVNNAGVLHEQPLLELTDAQIAESIAVHLTSPIRLIRSLVPGMVARGYGRIVNVSSGWGSFAEGMGGPGDYGITKAALNALTVRLAKELPPAVKVNAMCPGWVRTRMGGEGATRTPEEGADTAVWLATLP
ncbi:MAG TPA: SDR family NAD(P)-dependent oxidoreductase, partial [Tepidisphaeraceae bacterium]|nr:SDR family NAD(P)-dependent oxidoreductase [Tepidisphaeraceae bacterium]